MNAVGLEATLSVGSLIVNDYLIKITPIESGYMMAVTKGNETQTMTVMDGQSAYQAAVAAGYTGTESDFEAAMAQVPAITGAESARVAAEQGRQSAEQGRKSAETVREESEKARVAAETLRESAENRRVSAEQDRASAEEQRTANWETLSPAASAATEAANTAAANANSKATAANAAAAAANQAAQGIDAKINTRLGGLSFAANVEDGGLDIIYTY